LLYSDAGLAFPIKDSTKMFSIDMLLQFPPTSAFAAAIAELQPRQQPRLLLYLSALSLKHSFWLSTLDFSRCCCSI